MTYYSALHYAAKAEKSANLAEQYATQATQFSGKVVQIGFDGFMENGRLVFKHSPAGVDIPYDLLDDYEYEIDMVYQGSDLADDVELVVKNGVDTINFVSALHRDSTTPVTVKDMKSVMRYDESTGYRWLFKAAFKITPLGDKVLLLYPVISIGGSGTGRNIGDIFYTSRLDDELNGAVEADGTIYSVEAYTGEQSVPALLAEGKLPYVSMAEYESIVSANGSCRAWGWDNGDTFRVPTLKDVYLMAGQAESAGEFISESLPNIRGRFHLGYGGDRDCSGAFINSEKNGSDFSGESDASGWRLYFSANASSPTYQDGAKVRPDSVRYRAMVQLATGVKEDATQLKEYKFNNPHFFGESKWTDVEPDNASWLVSNGNFHLGATYVDYYKWLTDIKSGIKTVDGVSVKSVDDEYTDYDFVINTDDQTFRLPLLNGEEDLPSDRKISLTIGATGSSEIAPANGFYCLHASNNTNSLEIYVGTSTNFTFHTTTHDTSGWNGVFVNVSKGDRIEYYYSGTGTPDVFQFIYAKGNGSLYFYVGDVLQDPALINAGGVLTDLATKTNSVQAAAASMPSGRFVDLTLGASGSTYTAPANGWFTLNMSTRTKDRYILFTIEKNGLNCDNRSSSTGAGAVKAFFPCKAKDNVSVYYDADGEVRYFRFIYAEGEN